MPPATPTRERLLDAAVQLIADNGIQAVTHRAVEQRAGVARGSTRYHFATRDELLAAVIGHVAQIDGAVLQQAAEHIAATSNPGSMDTAEVQDFMAGMLSGFLAAPQQSLVRFELYLYAARRPELQDTVAQWRAAFTELAAAYYRARGAADPDASARMVIAAPEGIMLHALSAPHPDYATWGAEWMTRLAQQAEQLGEPKAP